MGAKSTNITSKQMLPLFQVLSDLEKPYESSISLGTSVSNVYLNSRALLNKDEFIIHHFPNSDNINSSRDLNQSRNIDENFAHEINQYPVIYGRCIDASNTKQKYKTRNRKKYKKRLKIEQGAMDEIRFRFNGKRVSEVHKNGTRLKNSHRKKNLPIKHSEAIINTDNSSPVYGNKTRNNRIGLFTEMGLKAFKEDDVDISRHFKNITREDLANSETDFATTGLEHSDPIYEVPKSARKLSKKIVSNTEFGSVSKLNRERKVRSKKIIQQYEEMLTTLMERNQNKIIVVQEKDAQLVKMKAKLKELLSVNNQFADENEYMKKQHMDMKACIDHYKVLVKSLEDHVEKRDQEMENCRGKCSNCNDKDIIAMKAERQSVQMSEDLLMLKNVVYRLNVQLSRYQDKLRNVKQANIVHKTPNQSANYQPTPSDNDVSKTLPVIEEAEDISMPPLPNFSQDINVDGTTSASEKRKQFMHQDTYSVELETDLAWGDVNTHTLAPLLNAYQESLSEKDQLIRDYECQFNRFTTKLKLILDENNSLHDAITKMANELSAYREKCGLAVTERDTLKKDCDSLKDKLNVLANKFTEAHTLYEQKVDAMSRDYTLIHEEYFQCKSSLSSMQARCQMLEEQCTGLKDQEVVPSNVHQNRIEECRRLFEDLKIRYENDKERSNTKINLLQQNNEMAERKVIDVTCEMQKLESKYKQCDHIVRKQHKEIHLLRNELQLTKSARDAARRRAGQATVLYKQLAVELQKGEQRSQVQKIKNEKIRETFKELDILESMVKEKDRNIILMKEENEQEITRLKEALRENQATIEAMKKHIDQERIKRYGSLQHLDANNLPEKVAGMKLSGENAIPKSIGGMHLPSANIIPVKGGYFVQKDRHKSSGVKET